MTGQASGSEFLSAEQFSLLLSEALPSTKSYSYVPGLGLLELSLAVVTLDRTEPIPVSPEQLVIPGMEHL